MDTISVNLVTADAPDRPIKIVLTRSIALKTFLDMAEQLLKMDIYSLYVNSHRLTDMDQLRDGDTVMVLNVVSPQVQQQGFFQPNENYESYLTDGVEGSVEVKVVILGPQGAGKTSLILRFILGFFKTNDEKTLVEAEYEKNIQVRGQNVNISILDTDGEFDCDKVARSWFTGRKAYIMALGIDQIEDWSMLTYYHKMLKRYVRNPNIFLIITKVDLLMKMDKAQKVEKKLKMTQIESFCKDQHILMFKTSAKINKKVYEMFLTVATRALEINGGQEQVDHEDVYSKQPFIFSALNSSWELCLRCLRR